MCVDDSGKSYFCEPQLLAHGDDHGKSCPCPCNDDDCEEHEIRLDPMLTDSVKVPSESCVILPPSFAVLFDPNVSIFLANQPDKRLPAVDDPNPAFRLRKDLMAGVVLRL
jgi:hypothetical protein